MKKLVTVLPLVLVLFIIVGCGDKAEMSEFEEFKTRLNVEQENLSLAECYVEALNDRDFEAFQDLLAPSYVVHNPSGSPESVSREAIIENYQSGLDAFSEFTWSIEELIAARDKVIGRFIARGKYKGGIPGLPAAEKEFSFSMITIMRIENGKVIEEWQEDDQLGLARQLGMELMQKEEEK